MQRTHVILEFHERCTPRAYVRCLNSHKGPLGHLSVNPRNNIETMLTSKYVQHNIRPKRPCWHITSRCDVEFFSKS